MQSIYKIESNFFVNIIKINYYNYINKKNIKKVNYYNILFFKIENFAYFNNLK